MRIDLKYLKNNLDLKKFIKALNKTHNWGNDKDLYYIFLESCGTSEIAGDALSDYISTKLYNIFDDSFFSGRFLPLISKNFKLIKTNFVSDTFDEYEEKREHWIHQVVSSKINKIFYVIVYQGYDYTNDGYYVHKKFTEKEKALDYIKNRKKEIWERYYKNRDKDLDPLRIIFENRTKFKSLPDRYKKDKKVIYAAMERDPKVLKYADESIKKDKSFILQVVGLWLDVLKYADISLRKDKLFIQEVVRQDGSALEYVHPILKKDKSIVLAAVKSKGWAILYADKSLTKDKLVVMEAVKSDGGALEYVDESLKKDKSVVLTAVKADADALEYAHKSLKKDKSFISLLVNYWGTALEFADESIKKNKLIVLKAIKQDGLALEFVDNKLKKDHFVALAAVKQNRGSLKFVDESIRKDIEGQLQDIFIRQAAINRKRFN